MDSASALLRGCDAPNYAAYALQRTDIEQVATGTRLSIATSKQQLSHDSSMGLRRPELSATTHALRAT
jgi:hypothetical protein